MWQTIGRSGTLGEAREMPLPCPTTYCDRSRWRAEDDIWTSHERVLDLLREEAEQDDG
jgi:hypothetical protein